ncbi:hypothetical protein BH09ACT7_BH09ACT7_35090 [soil metagenome]
MKSATGRIVALIGLIAVVASTAAFLIGSFSSRTSSSSESSSSAPSSGPSINGTYRVDYDAKAQSKNGKPVPADPIPALAWSFRSACPDDGCVATASRLREGGSDLKVVLDLIDGHWVEAHMAEAGSCPGGASAPHLSSWSLEPRPDGTFTGTQTDMFMGNSCTTVLQTPIILTRVGDAVPTAVDPAALPPRIPSIPERLHGQYSYTSTKRGTEEPGDRYPVDVRTICARNSVNCASLLTSREDVGRDNVAAYQFLDNRWTWGVENDGTCTAGDVVKGSVHQKIIVDLPLPQPSSDPITQLTGTSTTEFTGECGENETSDVTLERLGD